MGAVRRFLLFWYDFVVGDDWTLAVGVVAAVLVTWALAATFSAAWIVMPLAVVAMLTISIGRAQRAAPAPFDGDDHAP
jgi:hypothetical protein